MIFYFFFQKTYSCPTDIVSYAVMLANHNSGRLLTSLKGATPKKLIISDKGYI